MKNEVLQRLKILLGDKSIKEFSEELEVKEGLIKSYLYGGRNPGFNFFNALARAGYDVNWLLTGKGTPRRASTDEIRNIMRMLDLKTLEVPLVGATGAGEAWINYENESWENLEKIPVPAKFVVGHGKLIAVRVAKDQLSMFPLIRPYDIVIVDTKPVQKIHPKYVYLIRDPDEEYMAFTLKYVSAIAAHTVILISANPDYPPRRIRLTADMNPHDIIIGRARLIYRTL